MTNTDCCPRVRKAFRDLRNVDVLLFSEVLKAFLVHGLEYILAHVDLHGVFFKQFVGELKFSANFA